MEVHTTLEDSSNAFRFMQDGSRPYRMPAVFEFLNEHFSELVIALNYDMHTGSGMAWHGIASLFAGLKALRLFPLGYLKYLIYR